MEKDIAIIGMAGRFPGAGSLQQLFELLVQGADTVGNISTNRIKNTTLDPNREYMVGGYLEDIDVFDHRLFNIAAAEAQTMDPHLRILLEVAYETFENAAYSPDVISGSNTAVFVADAALEYYKLAETFVPTLASGNTKAFLASMLSRKFDLRGNSLTVDTTCSSSLLAIHLACNELILGDADMALAGAANLYLFPYKGSVGLDLDAPDGKSKAFSAQANGMSHGEAVACVLLKRLDKAVADGDIIHAVIKGSAVNSNAGRSASVTAPDSEAQADVIRMAWKKAGIDPRRLGFMEVHGSGTVLGDNIEIGGLTLAFNTYTSDKQWCPISTIKSNIGHTRSAAGIAGLLKTVLSLKHQVLFPNIHFDAPHPQINFQRSAVYVNRSLRPWTTENGARYAGVSSIGLSGTNCHMVLEEAPLRAIHRATLTDGAAYLLPVTGHTPEALKNNVAALAAYLSARPGEDLANISYTLCCGRKHYSHRMAVVAGNIAQASTYIQHWLNEEQEYNSAKKPVDNLVFIFDEGNNTVAHYQSQYHCYKWLEERGITTTEIMATQGGLHIARVISGEINMEAAVERIKEEKAETMSDMETRVSGWLQRATTKGKVVLVCMSASLGELALELKRQAAANEAVTFVSPEGDAEDACLLQVVKKLYELNVRVDWKEWGAHINGSRIELPAYRFVKQHCWIREIPPATGVTQVITEEVPDLAAVIEHYWKEVLNIQHCQLFDNFFELGGDSIKATRVINGLNRAYGVHLDFEDIFDYPTIAALAGYLDSICGTGQKIYKIWKDVLGQESLSHSDNFFDLGGHSLIANQIINRIRKDFEVELNFDDLFQHPTVDALSTYVDSLRKSGTVALPPIEVLPVRPFYEASHAQKRLWILGQSPEGVIAYNQPGLYKIGSMLDKAILEKAFMALITRHEILRTTFLLEGDRLVQKTKLPEQSGFKLRYLDFRGHADATQAAILHANEQAARQFDLETGPLMDALLIQTGDAAYVMLLNLHHIITDGWSNGVMVHDLLNCYYALLEGKEPALPPLRIQYKEYAAWQNEQIRNGVFDKHRHYWLQQFEEAAAPLRFPADFPRPEMKAFKGAIAEFAIDELLTARIKEYAMEHNVTLFMLLLANLNVLLYHFSGQSDITIGTTLANRDHVELEDQMGFYVNTLAIRTVFDAEMTFSQLLSRIRSNTLQAFEHGIYPFDLLVEDLQLERDQSRSPLFDIMLTLQNMDNNRRYNSSRLQQLHVESIEPDIHISKFDLLFCVTENNGRLEVLLEYDTALLTPATVQKVREGFVAIFEHLQANLRMNELKAVIQPPSQQEKVLLNDFLKAIQEL
jgi:3-oxoacyl-(acyl-carrier-protein) synthase/acyl carrier protein